MCPSCPPIRAGEGGLGGEVFPRRPWLTDGAVRLMDGAMNSELRRRGLPDDGCAPAWSLNYAPHVLDVYRTYVSVGATVLLANTFLSDPVNLARHGLEDRLEEINRNAFRQALSARASVAHCGVRPV